MKTVLTPAARIAIAAALMLWAIISLLPAKRLIPLAATAPAEEFSAERAMVHVKAIAQQPHPVSSPENARVRDYIRAELAKLGIESQLQSGTAEHRWRPGGKPVSAYVENVVARVPGTANTRPVLLIAHYDSVGKGPGAADDASGVAALLETARLLRSTPRLRNDVILLFTDGEERGLIGAHLFARDHPWAYETGIVINLDCGANGGIPTMYQASAANDWLLAQVHAAAPGLRAWSFATPLLPTLGMFTDLSPMMDIGAVGMTLGFGDNMNHRHRPEDDISRLDRASVQELGTYTTALVRHFGQIDLAPPRSGDAVYFTTRLTGLIAYSRTWAVPFAVIAFVTWFVAAAVGWHRGRHSVWGTIPLGFMAIGQLVTAVLVPDLSGVLTWSVFAAAISFVLLVTAPVSLAFGWRLALLAICPGVVFSVLAPLIPVIMSAVPGRNVRLWAPMVGSVCAVILITVLPQLVLLFRRTRAQADAPRAAAAGQGA